MADTEMEVLDIKVPELEVATSNSFFSFFYTCKRLQLCN